MLNVKAVISEARHDDDQTEAPEEVEDHTSTAVQRPIPLDAIVGAGKIQFHSAIGDDRWTCVAIWELLSTVLTDAGATRSIKCRVRDNNTLLLPTSRLLASAIFSTAAVGEISTVLVPITVQLGGEASRSSRG